MVSGDDPVTNDFAQQKIFSFMDWSRRLQFADRHRPRKTPLGFRDDYLSEVLR
jgi:hypothetical protein